MVVRHLENDTEFPRFLEQAGMKLVVVDFFATWCPPCRDIAPVFEQLSQRYMQAHFLKVDVEKCPVTAQSQGISAMPTFIYYINKNKVDTLRGGNAPELEAKIKKWVETAEASGGGAGGDEEEVPGQMDLYGFVSKKDSECLNESDDHQLNDCMNSGGASYLESDADEQLIINIPFNQPVKLHSLKIKGHGDRGPKTVKIFINLPRTLDFDQAAKMEPTQLLELSESQLMGEIINLRYVKFQNVQNVQFFVEDNQAGAPTTRISMLKIFGSPINATNMGDFKRVAGKKGEGH